MNILKTLPTIKGPFSKVFKEISKQQLKSIMLCIKKLCMYDLVGMCWPLLEPKMPR